VDKDREGSIIRLRSALDGTVTCARSLRGHNNYLPESGSQAAEETEVAEDLADEWSENPLRQALDVAALQLAAAEDYLTAPSLLLSHEVALSPFVMSRASLEASARGWHLRDPGISTKERVARGMTERLHGLAEVAQFGERYAERAEAERVPKIIESATRQGFRVLPPKRPWLPYAIDEQRPGMMEAIESLIVQRGEPGVGRLMARYMSGMTHATAGALIQLLERYPDPLDAQRVLGEPILGLKTMVPLAAMTLLGAIRAIERQVILYGWDRPTWEAWQQSALRTGRELMGLDQRESD